MVQLLHNIVVFVSGAVLMAFEIVGSRVLAPYFGSSIFVWGSLISVVMAALEHRLLLGRLDVRARALLRQAARAAGRSPAS